jgi:hypothetical protein
MGGVEFDQLRKILPCYQALRQLPLSVTSVIMGVFMFIHYYKNPLAMRLEGALLLVAVYFFTW